MRNSFACVTTRDRLTFPDSRVVVIFSLIDIVIVALVLIDLRVAGLAGLAGMFPPIMT